MGSGIGLAWWHHSKLYVNQFNEPIPKWVNDIQIYNRLRLSNWSCASTGVFQGTYCLIHLQTRALGQSRTANEKDLTFEKGWGDLIQIAAPFI